MGAGADESQAGSRTHTHAELVSSCSCCQHAAFNREVEELYATFPQRLIRVQLEDVMALCTDAETNVATPTAASAAAATSDAVAATAAPSSSSSNRLALQSLFASLKDPSDKADLRDRLRLRLLGHLARRAGFAQVVLGHNASRTAFDAFADTTKGRGSTVPMCVLAREHRFQVEWFFPLRDSVSSVVALYNHYKRLHPVFRPTFLTLKKSAQAGAGGINRLTHGEERRAHRRGLAQEHDEGRDATQSSR